MTRSNDFLMTEARELLSLAESRPEVQAYRRDLPLSPIWKENELFKQQFMGGSSFEAMMQLQTRLFAHGRSQREAELAVQWHLNRMGSNYRANLLCSDHSPEDSVVRIGGQRYWHDDFRHLCTMQRAGNYLEFSELRTVVELGAGCGNLARMVKMGHPRIRYIIIDLPDTLVYSHMFLRANFPDASFHFVCSPEDYKTEPAADFTFIPVGMEPLLHGTDIDLFINTASMGEMRQETVEHWFRFVQDHTRTKYLLSVNRFLNAITLPQHAWRLEENTHAFQFDRNWDILDWELDPDFLRCPWQNRHARQLFVLAKRTDYNALVPSHFLDGVRCASWLQPPHEMSVQAPPMSPDFTKHGLLYRLWEAHRYDVPGSAGLMCQYLDFLNRGRRDQHFEEFYQLGGLHG